MNQNHQARTSARSDHSDGHSNAQNHFKKPQAAKPVCSRIAIVFDFDDTLAPDTFDELIKRLGLDVHEFRQQRAVKHKSMARGDRLPIAMCQRSSFAFP
jgi:hypothetical protein